MVQILYDMRNRFKFRANQRSNVDVSGQPYCLARVLNHVTFWTNKRFTWAVIVTNNKMELEYVGRMIWWYNLLRGG